MTKRGSEGEEVGGEEGGAEEEERRRRGGGGGGEEEERRRRGGGEAGCSCEVWLAWLARCWRSYMNETILVYFTGERRLTRG